MFVAVKPYHTEYFVSVDEILVLDTSDWSLGYISVRDMLCFGIPIRLDCFDCQHKMYTSDFAGFLCQIHYKLDNLTMYTRMKYRLGNILIDIDNINSKSVRVNDIKFAVQDSFSVSAFMKGLSYLFKFGEYTIWRFGYQDLQKRQSHLSIATDASGNIISIWNAFSIDKAFGNKGLALRIDTICNY